MHEVAATPCLAVAVMYSSKLSLKNSPFLNYNRNL